MTPPLEEDRQSTSLDLHDKVAFREHQAELLGRAAQYCKLTCATDEAPILVVWIESAFAVLARFSTTLALPCGKWIENADLNQEI